MLNIIMADVVAGGIPGSKITSYVTTSGNLYENFTLAHIPLIAENEILIWNIRGVNAQTLGNSGKKMGYVCTQNGDTIPSASGSMGSQAVAPDSMTPAGWSNYAHMHVENGYYVGNGGSFYCGIGNTIDFIQIPYNMGWNV